MVSGGWYLDLGDDAILQCQLLIATVVSSF